MGKYLESETHDFTSAELKTLIRKSTLACKITPVLCGSAFKTRASNTCLTRYSDYMPSPQDVPHITGIDPETGEEAQRSPDDNQPFSALAFKIMSDPHIKRLTYFEFTPASLRAAPISTTLPKTSPAVSAASF